MSRRHAAQKREVIPDPKFHDSVVTKFMNAVMEHGKKSVAERMVYGAFDKMEQKGKANPLEMFKQALDNGMPAVEVAFAPRRWCNVSGSDGSSTASPTGSWHSLDHRRSQRSCNESTLHRTKSLAS